MLTSSERKALNMVEEAVKKEDDEIRAKYKVEVHLGKDRSISALGLTTGCMTIWESGKRFHGGGDEKMYWCGYTEQQGFSGADVCDKPISVENFGYYHTVCPHCQRECFLDPEAKKVHINDMKARGLDHREMAAMPFVVGERFAKLPPAKWAHLIEKVWRQLQCNADVYLKYHPSDIRYDPSQLQGAQLEKRLNDARRDRNDRHRGAPMIYPLKNILKDTASGAEVWRRFLAMLTA